jgi:hypothetical protein
VSLANVDAMETEILSIICSKIFDGIRTQGIMKTRNGMALSNFLRGLAESRLVRAG